MRRLVIAGALLLVGGFATPRLHSQAATPDQKPQVFEVATIKPDANSDRAASMRIPAGGRFQAHNIAVKGLIGFAYPAYEQIGLPRWAEMEHYDIEAKGNASASRDETLQMVRALLRDRFRLETHYEQRSRRVLALTVTGARPDRLQRIDADCSPDALKNRPFVPPPSGPDAALAPCTSLNSGSVISSGGMTMQYFAQQLTSLMQEPVIDQTGLKGYYKFTLKFTRTEPGVPPPSDEYPVIPTALDEQLGLRLKRGDAAVDVVVIDHVEKPTPD